jgi:hypothetical protein
MPFKIISGKIADEAGTSRALNAFHLEKSMLNCNEQGPQCISSGKITAEAYGAGLSMYTTKKITHEM